MDGSADRGDAIADMAADAAGSLDARDGASTVDAAGDTRDAPTDTGVADAIVERGDAGDARADAADGPTESPTADAGVDGTDAADAADAADADLDVAASDAGMETSRPYVERDCSRQDACACASNESCSFNCPGGDCAVTCAPGSTCVVTCAAPFNCSVSCGDEAQCLLACNLGVCSHFFGPARDFACDPTGTGCP